MSESFVVRVTTLPEEILEAQKLRYAVYYKERMNAKSEGLDVDMFDAYCEHLIVEEVSSHRIVGTYRLISRKAAEQCGTFYSQNEFDIQKILESKENILELGRACVDRAYRTKGIIRLLWKGLSDYIAYHNIRYLFGCASFEGIIPEKYQHGFSYLHYAHRAPEYIRPEVLSSSAALIKILEPEEVNINKAWSEIPSLLRGYLQVGGWVGQGIFQDLSFSSLDACVVVDTRRLVLGGYGAR
ncbi:MULTISPECIES: GNAT family N-acetyltransferase [Holospora]|uniref:L-ornithine N(alpha)-acyltransferase n=2 Tax=Holospora TaxID=44747 RepID=A0A061JHX1_9PROT|nr:MULTISPECIES: GNAT family N-acyltransferase [Holospora]ETZ04544.1 N-acyl amino acid synthase, PEP-CTERM/exosortase system-associated [Holospora undulata HU1]GAJ46459.1 N-acyl amino acid synthase, PEP-CTERM/exosortase system-associated [Holospora elegans E1]